MKCECGKKAACINTRPNSASQVYRRYGCSCGARFSTIEQLAEGGKRTKSRLTQAEIETLTRLLQRANISTEEEL